MKKRISIVMTAVIISVMMLAGCSADKSVTYNVDTGDSVKITVDAKAGYNISMELPFTVTKDDATVLNGSFIYAEYYDTYREVVDAEAGAVLLDEGTRDGNDYFFYSFEGNSGTEYDYIILVNNSQTAIAMASLVGEKEASEAFQAMTISLGE